MTTSPKTIPLKDLVVWNGNVRKTEGSDTGLAELAASIQSVGIINPLTVFAKGKKFAVVAGSRRFAALSRLLESKVIDERYEVPCTFTTEQQASEVSLAENVIREDMHPADEFEAFLKLSKGSMSNEDIAARFGVTKTVVEKRLKLANVSPKIIAAYRKGELDLECVMAYAVTDDVKRQEKVFKTLAGYRGTDADNIRSALTEGDIDAGDKRVRFVGLKAYEKAGGKTRRDLFADEKDASGIYILDVELLEDLVAKKLDKTAAALRKEGWSWVEIRSEFGYDARGKFKQLREESVPLPEGLQEEHSRLTREYNAIHDSDDEITDEQSARVDEIDTRISEIEASQETAWPEGTFDVAGAIVTLGYNGEADVTRGLVRPADVKKLAKPKKACGSSEGTDEGAAEGKPAESSGLSAKLNTDLTKHRTAAISAALVSQPGIALAAIVHALAGEVFTQRFRGDSCLQLTAKTALRARDVPGDANDLIERERAIWADKVPGDADALWHWCLEQNRDTLLELLAFCVALTVDAVTPRGRGEEADYLAHALRLDMSHWFTPTAANFFGGISKPQIIAALQETKGTTAPAWTKAKKSELAAIAEREIAGTGWLPEILRSPAEDSVQAVKKAA